MQLSRDDILAAWRTMVRIRAFEEQLIVENAAGHIEGHIHLYIGQEAIAAGVCHNLHAADIITSTHRGHGHALAKGVDAAAMMAEVMGRRTGCCGGKGGSMHIADLSHGHLGANGIVGANAPLALGAALTARTLGKDTVAIAFLGDGGANQGAVFETMNMAASMKLPVIFVIEDNGYGEYTPAHTVTGTDSLAARAGAFGMRSVEVDGTDFFAVEEAARDLVSKARAGDGPSTLVAKALRLGGHYEGDTQAYRLADEEKTARQERDCLKIFHNKVVGSGIVSGSKLNALHDEAIAEMRDAARNAHEAPGPAYADLLSDVLAGKGSAHG